MAIVPITSDNLERFKLQTSPKRTLISSSNGLTGSIPVFGRTSPREKDAFPPADFTSAFDGATIEQYRLYAVNKVQQETLGGASGSDISGNVEVYLDAVNKAPQSAVKSKRVEITRFEPSHKFTKDTMRKNVVKNVLFPRYRPLYKSCDWSYPNYHTLNFFTGSTVSDKSCLIYPCSTGSAQTADVDSFPYTPGDTFTFEFWINPRYTTDKPTNGPGGFSGDPHYHAGTIMHLSSSYCISLVTGSSVDQDGYPDGFRIMFQLGHAAQTRPHHIGLYNKDALGNTSTNPRFGATLKSNDQLFTDRATGFEADPSIAGIEDFDGSDAAKGKGIIALTDDNSLKKNHWHHVAIRGGKSINNKKGSFYVDGQLAGTFPLCASDYAGNLMPLQMSTDDGDPDALIVGNYIDTRFQAGNEPNLARFFNINTAYREGLVSMYRNGTYDKSLELAGEPAYSDPTSTKFQFTNPLNAELHEIRIWKEYRSLENIVTGSKSSLTELSGSLMFYVPPWFTKETRKRDVLQTPFQTSRQKTDDPFNVALSFGVGGRELNLPNFTRELVQGVTPRLYHLTVAENPGQTEFMSANELMYDAEYTTITGEAVGSRDGEDRGFASIRKGNLTVLPNDNGLFSPDWTLLGKKDTDLGSHGIVAASGSIVYTNSPANGQTIELTTTSGVTKKLMFKDGGTNGAVDSEGRIAVTRTGTADTDYGHLVTTIKLADVFSTDIIPTLDDSTNTLTLRQGINGSSGNTTITHNLSNATVTSFQGGEDDDSLTGTTTDKFVDSFGTKNLGLISLEKMVSTGSIPEGLVDITSEFRGLPGIGAAAAQAEITWTANVGIEDKSTLTLTSHNGKSVTYKFLNTTLSSRPNGQTDTDGTIIIDARPSVDSPDNSDSDGTGNINDIWYRLMLAINGFRKEVSAGSFIVGETYKISIAGTTDFTTVGAANSTVGTEFVATATGSGSGKAIQKTDDTFMFASAPSMLGTPTPSYDSFDPAMTSIIITQSIKGTAGNTALTRTGNWDATITVPSNFTGGTDNPDASILNSLEGATPEDPGIAPGSILTILNRTRDPSSNEVVFFDTSNLFYGNRIKPSSFVIKDTAITGSGGRVGICLRDNGEGGLYRDDCKTKVASWNEIGSIIYEEGIAVVKTPNIPFFGKDQFEVTMEGDHNVHVLEINVPAPKGKVNSSSNPSFKNLTPSDYASETADKFVYITSINLHDENFNIVGRANLAQPVVKRDTDGYMFRLKMDY